MSTPRARVALYSPGMVGLGHVRRNLLIAQALVRSSLQPAVLLIAEAQEAAAFIMPPGVDCVTLPALSKTWNGQCRPRRLPIDLQDVVDLRTRVIRSALGAFRPHVLIVDHLPWGAARELDPVLEDLHRGGSRCVLGLRDVLGDPDTAQREWAEAQNFEAIDLYYDTIWVYGDPAVYDLAVECRFPPDVTSRVRYTGYLDQRGRVTLARMDGIAVNGDAARKRLFLCAVGGGQDGGCLAQAFAEADFPADTLGVILTGPFMPPFVQARLRRDVRERPHLQVLGFIPEPALLVARAERVVAMGGYNTICEVLSFRKPALIVPRAGPRREQMIRAERFRALGIIDVVHHQGLNPGALTNWFRQDLAPVLPAARVDLNGLKRIVGLIAEMLGMSGGAAEGLGPEKFQRVAP